MTFLSKKIFHLLKLVLTLSHVERGFSINKSVVDENINPSAIVARRSLKNHIITNSLKPHTIEITSGMKLAFKYAIKLDEEKNMKRNDAAEKQKSIINSEIDEVKSKVSQLMKTVKILENDFITCVENAEKENNLSLISKSNALKGKSVEKKEQIQQLDKSLDILKTKQLDKSLDILKTKHQKIK